MKPLSLVIAVVVVASMSVSAFAFDGQRKGFILGGGIGLGMISHTEKNVSDGVSNTFDGESKVAFQTDFKMGWGASEQLEIYYIQKSSFFRTSSVYVNDVTVMKAIGGIGSSYSLSPSVPTFVLSGGIGLAMWMLPFENNAPEAWSGFGLFGGVGYEFSKHYSVALDLAYGNPKHTENFFWGPSEEWSTSAFSVRVTINALAY